MSASQMTPISQNVGLSHTKALLQYSNSQVLTSQTLLFVAIKLKVWDYTARRKKTSLGSGSWREGGNSGSKLRGFPVTPVGGLQPHIPQMGRDSIWKKPAEIFCLLHLYQLLLLSSGHFFKCWSWNIPIWQWSYYEVQ